MTPVLFILGATGLIVLMYWFAVAYSRATIRRTVESPHRDAQIITESGLAPPTWKNRLLVRVGPARLAKWYALRRIDRLVRYFRHTPLTESEEARELVVTRLTEVRSDWARKCWEEIFPYK